MLRFLITVLLLAGIVPVFAAEPAGPHDVDIPASDGTKLKATYFSAGRPGPGVILLHMCNSNRKGWEPVGRQLSAVGINALALDYRGYGESGGERIDFRKDPQKLQQMQTTKWPGDEDAAFSYLIAQPGIDKRRIGSGGGSCGVNQAVQTARRHAEVISLVLLAGSTDVQGLRFLRDNAWLPLFTSAAADDEFDDQAPQLMRWLSEVTGNPGNRFVGFANGRHGTEIFGPHPELVGQIVDWYVQTLIKHPPDRSAKVSRKKTPIYEFWTVVNQPGGVVKAVEMFRAARKRDPKVFLFPEQQVNQMAYDRMQAHETKDALELCELNVEAYPASSNAYDSLADAYVAAGREQEAIQASRKALELLPTDKINPMFKDAVRQSAEQRLQKLKATATP